MTSQDPWRQNHTLSKITMEMCGRVRDVDRSRVPRARIVSCFMAFPDCSPAFPCVTVSFFLSFEIERFQFPFFCLTSLFVCARARAFLFCSGWLLDFPAPFSLRQYVIPWENYTSMTSVDCRVISSLHVQFNEMKVRPGHSYVRIQASDGCKSAFEVAPLLEGSKPTAHRSRDVGGREAGIHTHARLKTTRSSAPSLPIWKVTSS